MGLRAIELQLDNPWAPFGLAFNYLEMGQRPEAIAMFRQAAQRKPDLAAAYLWLGIMLREQGQLKDAVAAFHRAIALDPNSGMAHFDLGRTLLDQGLYAEGQKSLRHSLDLLPKDDWPRAEARAQLERSERLVALEPKLPALLAGKAQPASKGKPVGSSGWTSQHS